MAQKSRHAPNLILRRLREERGWSLQRVADELRLLAEAEDENRLPGVNANMVGVWERGWKRPSPYYQAFFCQLYQRPASQLGFMGEEMVSAPLAAQKPRAVSCPTPSFPPVPSLALAHEQTRTVDLLCSHQEMTSEQQAGAWLTLGASGLSQLFTEGWSLNDILTSLQLVLQGMQALPPITRRQLLHLGGAAMISSIPMPAGERISEEERMQFTQAGASWDMLQSLICQSDDYHALGQHNKAIQILEEALRITDINPADEDHLRSKAHVLACWADNGITLGDYEIAQKKLDASATFLDQIGPHEEFDNASWLQLAGKYAFMTGDYAKTIKYYEQALVEVSPDWVLRRTLIVIPMIVACACQHEREASLRLAEQALFALHVLKAPTLNTQFHVAIHQALARAFPDDGQVQSFIATVF